jgi:hypothetical protein
MAYMPPKMTPSVDQRHRKASDYFWVISIDCCALNLAASVLHLGHRLN